MLSGMRQHDLLNSIDVLEQIVNAAPIPARFQHHSALALQPTKKLSETKSRVAPNAFGAPSQLPAPLIYCNNPERFRSCECLFQHSS